MKKLTLIIASLCLFLGTACTHNAKSAKDNELQEEKADTILSESEVTDSSTIAETDSAHFGKMIDADGALTVEEFVEKMKGVDTLNVKIAAIANEVCQKKGCWMKVQIANGESMRIRFKDYAFFVPKDISGRRVVFEGIAFRDTTSVADLKHYAEDEGKSEDEIAAITKSEVKTAFLANGVLIR